jgi:hypothetical protein
MCSIVPAIRWRGHARYHYHHRPIAVETVWASAAEVTLIVSERSHVPRAVVRYESKADSFLSVPSERWVGDGGTGRGRRRDSGPRT